MSNEKTTSGGLGFVGALTIAFIVLKLMGVIDWRWVWVLAPAWIGVAGIFGALIIGLAISFWIHKHTK